MTLVRQRRVELNALVIEMRSRGLRLVSRRFCCKAAFCQREIFAERFGDGIIAERALPHGIQVADRWHLKENASAAFLDAVRKTTRSIRSVIGATTNNPQLLTSAEKLQYEGYVRREETNAVILALAGPKDRTNDDIGSRSSE